MLRRVPVGRLALCVQGEPEIFPINFVIDHGTIVFRTSEGTKARSAEKAAVAFEADGMSVPGAEVWSVVIKGHASTINRTPELMETVHLPLHPWEAGRKDRFMRLVPGTISGRAFTPASQSADVGAGRAPDE